MSDDRGRARERDAVIARDPATRAASLAELLRRGERELEVRAAALLGDPAAALVLPGLPAPPTTEWVQAIVDLRAWGATKVLWAVARVAVEDFERRHHKPRCGQQPRRSPTRVGEGIRFCPDCGNAYDPLPRRTLWAVEEWLGQVARHGDHLAHQLLLPRVAAEYREEHPLPPSVESRTTGRRDRWEGLGDGPVFREVEYAATVSPLGELTIWSRDPRGARRPGGIWRRILGGLVVRGATDLRVLEGPEGPSVGLAYLDERGDGVELLLSDGEGFSPFPVGSAGLAATRTFELGWDPLARAIRLVGLIAAEISPLTLRHVAEVVDACRDATDLVRGAGLWARAARLAEVR